MRSSRKQMSAGLTFAAGALFGAIAALVPLSSAGHFHAEAPKHRSPAVASSAPAAIGKPARADSKDKRPSPSIQESNEATCEVQLD